MQLVMTGQQVTMSSREIADLVGSRHSDVMRSIDRLIEREVIGRYAPVAYTHPQNGATYPEYLIGKRDTYIIVAQMSPEFTAKLVDRWQELEAKQAKPAELSRMDILQIAMEAEQGRLEAEKKLAIAAPKAEFVDSYVQAKSGSMGLREVCKVLRAKEPEFVSFLLGRGFMYRTTPESPLTPKADHIHNGRFEAKTGMSRDNGHVFVQYKFTPKGVNWIAGEWGKYQVQELF